MVIGQVLKRSGHDVTLSASAEEALERFREAPYPLVITDVIMGGKTGLELLQAVKDLAPETLVVIMTSHASLETAMRAIRDGAYDFLLKPFDDLFVIAAVAERARDRILLFDRNRLLTRQLEAYAEELERLNRELRESADRDGLTGLFNHRYFVQALKTEAARSTRQGHSFGLILLDVDHFKSYNDVHGHPAGDELLRGLAAAIREAHRQEGVTARYGGEEFAVLLPETDRDRTALVAERIRATIEQTPFPGRETQPLGRITVSLGLACFPEDAGDPAAILRHADEALYQAKRAGRNRLAA
jgi:diguanylate cyclase (GGDEF)-like protein